VVGIPGRVIGPRKKPLEGKRQKLAEKMGFDAYGTSQDMPDPVANAFHGLIEHIHLMDERMEKMAQVICEMGGDVPCDKLPEINRDDITPMED